MNLYAEFAERIRGIVTKIGLADPVDAAGRLRFVVEPPRDPSHGDFATNAAMVLAKGAGKPPREIATAIAAELAGEPDVTSAEVAGPGFINIRVAPAVWHRLLGAIVAAGPDFGRSGLGGGEPINVEYVSANPTGPMHVGHCRGAVFGDALASLLAYSGWKVTREYYINDAGAQVDVLARSAFLRYREALGREVGAIPEGLYPGDYLKPVGAALAAEWGEKLEAMAEAEWLPIVRAFTIDAMMAMIRSDLEALGVHHDLFSSEKALSSGGRDRVTEAIEHLKARGDVYVGRLEPPKGQLPEDWEDREQILFRSTAFGDDVDRPLIKSDGSFTYFASDIAYHYDKYLRGFRQMVDVLGADHGGYVKRMQAAVKAMTGGEGSLDIRLCQLVKLFRAGEPVRMSKRSGDFVTLRDVVDEVGRDAVRFMMLYRKNDAPLDFDFQKVTEQSRDNPVFYVQYAHARCRSVFRQAGEDVGREIFAPGALADASLNRLEDESELSLIAKLGEWPRLVEAAAEAREPHRIGFYLYDLAGAFHGHWNRGKERTDLRFINPDDRESTKARLALVHAVADVLAGGLALLGVSAPEEMR
ncbi:arginyl-tRNA synthetase [Pseudoxanthobacter soli DSM 19599]|uniref:Arginine--tRNA ligase n=1 Tax=Pseudoxanthobacter soli DSM 19599 TaxID=1123029 RepID=A0A1M7Z770_9HYPH|nr:arginine--tRNA ligase [Pseudoxanthobacter soli]SHO60516.1 arginyl-tRNA synthetase [Pseudoxanthobacter soli DSM 19599]